jgi:hypothetical protein
MRITVRRPAAAPRSPLMLERPRRNLEAQPPSSLQPLRAAIVVGPARNVLRLLLATTLVLSTLAVAFATSATPADAAITHEFLKPLSDQLEMGVPADCAGEPVPPCIPGPLSGVSALTVDSGHLWVAERIQAGRKLGASRVDSFDAAAGGFLPPQLDEEGGVSELDVGIAVGHPAAEQNVYVAAARERQNVVAVFGPSGKLQPEGVWSGANTPNKTFGSTGVSSIVGVALDGSASLETHGDVYVAARLSSRSECEHGEAQCVVDVFSGEAGGKEPAQVLGQIKGPETPCVAGPGQEACVNPLKHAPCKKEGESEEGESEKGCVLLFALPTGVAVSPVNGDVLVADGDREGCERGEAKCGVDVFEPVAGMPGVYNFLFAIKGAPGEPFKDIGPMAIDGEGDVYVVEKQADIVEQFDAAGKYLSRLTGTPEGPFKGLESVAADPASGNVYVGDFDQVLKTGAVDAFGPSRVVPDVTTSGGEARVSVVSGEGKVEATLKGTVNPLGEGAATCTFVWGATPGFGQTAPCDAGVPEGNAAVPVKATITAGLAPDTSYTFRLQATNENGTNPGEDSDDRQLLTPGPGVHSESVSGLASTSAKLNALIDPNKAPTIYYFQYGRSAAYEAQAPAAPGALGEGKGDVQVAPQHIQDLLPGTIYHYRVVAVSVLSIEGSPTAVTFAGPDQTFTTQGAAGGPPLPDGRRWELVSPPDKHGALLQMPGEAAVIQAAGAGGAIAYTATLPTEAAVKGYVFLNVPVLASRGAGGWSSQDISLAHPSATGIPIGTGPEYRFFSEDLSLALVEPLGEFTSLAPEVFPPDTERGPYLRHDSTCAATPATCYQPLLTGAPGYADVPEGTKFGGEARFVGASGDLAHVILSSPVALTAPATGGNAQLYELSPGRPAGQQLQLLSAAAAEKGEVPQLGLENRIARHAVSQDGSRVVWSVGAHVFLSELARGETPLQLDLPQAQCEECGGEAGARFQLASADGSRVLFTDTERLTADAGKIPNEADLYECRIAEGACALSDLTPAPGHAKAADMQGAVIGSSEDATSVYFVANGVLGDGAEHGASAGNCEIVKGNVGQGTCNLYVAHEGATHWIATVAGEDYPDWTGKGGAALNRLTARVSPDGRFLAFMSQRSLTGYDNVDASPEAKGARDEEVFLYHATSPGVGTLACASCDPSGARPLGVEYAQISEGLVGGDEVWNHETWIAANVPGWTPYEQSRARYQPRYLSDSGRLFFDSNDALVAQDINRNQDVYQFEPAGVGDCSSASSTFSAPSGGCVALISSGVAAGESALLDASEGGDDVFFLTGERLTSKDVDTALDLYDAHVCSSTVPCFQEAEAPPPCTTAESCRAAPSTQPGIFGSPSSSTFSGQGNLTPTPPPPPSKPKLTAKQQLAKVLAACRKIYKKSKKRRAACERQAHKRYGAKKARKVNLNKAGNR